MFKLLVIVIEDKILASTHLSANLVIPVFTGTHVDALLFYDKADPMRTLTDPHWALHWSCQFHLLCVLFPLVE